MVKLPALKFDKSTTYLNDQLLIQNNNKQLILDIITNIGIMKNQSNDSSTYNEILKSANNFLNITSSNITTIEQLSLEIANISKDLQSEQNKKNKSKEFYIAYFSTLKRNIENFTFKFQNLEKKLEKDNLKFNDFINENNFKYNIITSENDNSYEVASFSVKDSNKNIIKTSKVSFVDHEKESCPEGYDVFNITPTEEQLKNKKIDALAEEFKNILKSASDIEDLSNSNPTELIKSFIENKLAPLVSSDAPENLNEISNEDNDELLEALLEDNSITLEDIEGTDVIDNSTTLKDVESTDVIGNSTNESTDSSTEIVENVEPTIESDVSISSVEDVDVDSKEKNRMELLLSKENKPRKDLVFSYIEIENTISEIIKRTIKSREYIKFEKNSFRFAVKENPFYDEEDSFEKIQNQVRSTYSDFFEFTSTHSFNDEILDEYAQYHYNPNHYEYSYNENIDEFIKPDIVNSEDLGIDSFVINQVPTAFDSMQFVNDLLENSEEKTLEDELVDDINDIDDYNVSSEDIENEENFENIEENIIDDTDLNNAILDNDTILAGDLDDELLNSILEEQLSLEENDNDIELDENDNDIELDENNNEIELDENDNDIELDENDNVQKKDTNFPKKPISKVFDFSDKDESFDEYDILRKRIEDAVCDSHLLLISEKVNQIYLPYTISELEEYLKIYPNEYSSLADVVNQEFIFPYDYFSKHQSISRFKETYILMKDRCMKELHESIQYATKISRLSNINPAVIAACKTKNELDSYIYYLESDNLERFKFFDIMFESSTSLKLPFNFKRAYKEEITLLENSSDEI